MTNRGLAFISVKMISIFFFVKLFLRGVPFLVNSISYPDFFDDFFSVQVITNLSIILIYLILGILFWLKAEALLAFFLPKDRQDIECNMRFTKESFMALLAIGFSIVGLLMTIFSLLTILRNMDALITIRESTSEAFKASYEVTIFIRSIIFFIGVWLFLKPTKLLALIKSLNLDEVIHVTSKSVVVAYIRIISIWLGYQGLSNIVGYLKESGIIKRVYLRGIEDTAFTLNGNFSIDNIMISMELMLVLIVLGIVLWAKAEKVAGRIMCKEENQDFTEEELVILQSVFFSITGLVVVWLSIIAIFRDVSLECMGFRGEEFSIITIVLQSFGHTLGLRLISLVLGFVLLFKPRKAATFLRHKSNQLSEEEMMEEE